MRIIAKRTLRELWERRPDSEQPLLDWYKTAERADWASPAQVRQRYPDASIIGGSRVAFNIKGNIYRLVTKISYPYRRVYTRFVGTLTRTQFAQTVLDPSHLNA